MKAHKAILASGSDVFEKMFQYRVAQNRDPNEPIEEPDIEPEAFRMMLGYIYTEDPEGLSWTNLFDVLKAGKYLIEKRIWFLELSTDMELVRLS